MSWHLTLLASGLSILGIKMAGAGSSTGADLSTLGNYGVVGVMLILFIGFSYRLISRETKRADENATEVKRLNELVQEKVIPALVDSGQALRESTELLREMARQQPPADRR